MSRVVGPYSEVQADERQDLGGLAEVAGGCNQDCNQDRLEQGSRAETPRDEF